MKLIQTRIPDVVIIEPAVYMDERGWFMESFNERRSHEELFKLGLPTPNPFVQDNQSCSAEGVLRGMHYQLPPHAQGKLVRVTQGAVFDVAVDICKRSETYGQWVGVELISKNKKSCGFPKVLHMDLLRLRTIRIFSTKLPTITRRSVRQQYAGMIRSWPLNGHRSTD